MLLVFAIKELSNYSSVTSRDLPGCHLDFLVPTPPPGLGAMGIDFPCSLVESATAWSSIESSGQLLLRQVIIDVPAARSKRWYPGHGRTTGFSIHYPVLTKSQISVWTSHWLGLFLFHSLLIFLWGSLRVI